MKRPFQGRRFPFLFAALACSALVACGHRPGGAGVLPNADAQRSTAAQTYTAGSVSLTITPNFRPGFGPVPYNTQLNGNGALQQPAPGPGSALKSGSVDFGSVEQNQDYLYAYAAQVAISTPNGFALYGETMSDLDGPTALPAASHLFWLPTATGKRTDGSTGDVNNTWSSASTPFLVNSSPGNGTNPPIYTSPAHNATLDFDYILRVGAADPIGSYSTTVTYSVVAL